MCIRYFEEQDLTRTAIVLLFVILILNLSLLEMRDIFDPSESRYASVAQEMVESGNWLTPQLPAEDTYVPYLGKPPFHFWLVAASYKVFGVDEWTTRLPNLLAVAITIMFLYLFANQYFNKSTAVLGAVVMATTGETFIVSSFGILDTTLTMAITVALVSFMLFFDTRGRKAFLYAILVAVGAAIGFLTKGPIALVLLGLPIAGVALLGKHKQKLRCFPWMSVAAVFIAITLPWFVLAEDANPGFLKYFFWNENIKRYLVKDYGDKYGSGHRYPHGMAIVFFMVGLLPWTPFAIANGWSWIRRHGVSAIPELESHILLLLFWALTPVLFFVFGKQLHFGYVLPGIPPMGILITHGILQNKGNELWLRMSRVLVMLIWMLCPMMIIAAILFGRDTFYASVSIGLAVAWMALSVFLPRAQNKSDLPASFILRYSYATAAVLFTAYIASTPIIDGSHSSENAINTILRDSERKVSVVGIYTQNTYSHYWVAGAWEKELIKKVKIKYVDTEQDAPADLLVEQKEYRKLPQWIKDKFRVRKLINAWTWLEAIA